MSDVFLSYADEDRIRVEPVAQAFETSGLRVFWDRSIAPGQTWRTTLQAEIEACGCVLVIWSRTSVRSRWVQEEADWGQRTGKLLCALIDDVSPPLGFGGVQAVDLRTWDGASHSPAFAVLLGGVRKLISRAPAIPEKRGQAAMQLVFEQVRSQGFAQVPGPPGLAFVLHKSKMGGLTPCVVGVVEVAPDADAIDTARRSHAFFEDWARRAYGKNCQAYLIFVVRDPGAAFVDAVLALGPRVFGGGFATPYVFDAAERKYRYFQEMIGTVTAERVKL